MSTLRVVVPVRVPPLSGAASKGGLDVDLVEAIGANLGLDVELVAPAASDVDGILAGLTDCAATGITVTPERAQLVAFAPPYLISGQALAVDAARFPTVRSIDDLRGLTVGVQQGNTGQPIAERLVADGRAQAARVYDRGDVRAAVSDLATGACDAFIELAPALIELVAALPDVDVVQQGISREEIAIAVPLDDDAMLHRITAAQAELEADGTLQAIRRRWLGKPYVDQSLAAH